MNMGKEGKETKKRGTKWKIVLSRKETTAGSCSLRGRERQRITPTSPARVSLMSQRCRYLDGKRYRRRVIPTSACPSGSGPHAGSRGRVWMPPAEKKTSSTSSSRPRSPHRISVESVQHLLTTLWGLACESHIASPGELLGIRRAARRASRGMRDGDPRTLWAIRTTLCVIQLFRVRSDVEFWTGPDRVGDGGFVPPVVPAWEKLKDDSMRIDGEEHHTSIEVRVEPDGDGERVTISVLPYGDDSCAVELIMNGAGARELGKWLAGRGRDGTGRGSMFSMGKKDA